MICPTCNTELKGMPKGVSKNGNPYDAFWAHTKGASCKEDVPMDEKDAKKINQAARAAKFDAELTKFKGMAWFNATNAAVEMVKGTMMLGDKEMTYTNQRNEEEVRKWRDWLYQEHLEFFIKHIIEETD